MHLENEFDSYFLVKMLKSDLILVKVGINRQKNLPILRNKM